MGSAFSNVRQDRRKKFSEMRGENVEKEAKAAQFKQKQMIDKQKQEEQKRLDEAQSEVNKRRLRLSQSAQGRSGLLGG